MNKTIKYFLVILILMFISTPVFAATFANPATDFFVSFSGGNTFKNIILKAISWILPVAGLIAVLFVIIGGFQYIMSGANEELAEQGKKTLKNAIIGVVIIVLSWVIISIVSKTLTT